MVVFGASIGGLSFLAGLVGMIGNLVALKNRPWTIALLVSLVPAVFLGISVVLTVIAFGLYGPRPRHPQDTAA